MDTTSSSLTRHWGLPLSHQVLKLGQDQARNAPKSEVGGISAGYKSHVTSFWKNMCFVNTQ